MPEKWPAGTQHPRLWWKFFDLTYVSAAAVGHGNLLLLPYFFALMWAADLLFSILPSVGVAAAVLVLVRPAISGLVAVFFGSIAIGTVAQTGLREASRGFIGLPGALLAAHCYVMSAAAFGGAVGYLLGWAVEARVPCVRKRVPGVLPLVGALTGALATLAGLCYVVAILALGGAAGCLLGWAVEARVPRVRERVPGALPLIGVFVGALAASDALLRLPEIPEGFRVIGDPMVAWPALVQSLFAAAVLSGRDPREFALLSDSRDAPSPRPQ